MPLLKLSPVTESRLKHVVTIDVNGRAQYLREGAGSQPDHLVEDSADACLYETYEQAEDAAAKLLNSIDILGSDTGRVSISVIDTYTLNI